MRRAAKIDDNQNEIVAAFRKRGFSVAITSSCHNGFPDLVVGKSGINYLVEVKDGTKPKSEQKLTQAQVKFSNNWMGQYAVVKSLEDVESLITKHYRRMGC